MKENDFRYIYLREEPKGINRRGFPVGVVALKIDRNENTVQYGIAVVHRDDRGIHYSKDMGRELAVGRLMLSGKKLNLPSKKYSTVRDITWMVMVALRDNKDVPTRAKKAVKRWLAYSLEADALSKATDKKLWNVSPSLNGPDSSVPSTVKSQELFPNEKVGRPLMSRVPYLD